MFLTKGLKIKNKEFKLGKEKEHIKLNLTQNNNKTFPAIGFWLSEKFDKIKDYNEEDRFASHIGETVFKHKGYFIKGVYFSESEEYRLRKFSN